MEKVGSRKLSMWGLLLVLVASLIWINPWARAEQVQVKRSLLKEFPAQVGDWRQNGMGERFDRQTEEILNAQDYLLRTYTAPGGEVASMFVGYYGNLEFNTNWHSPTVCLPGSGWVITPQEPVQITPAGQTRSFKSNYYIVQKNDERSLMLYWYQGRGRFLTDGFWTKVYTSLDALNRHRSDGAIVRVVVPIKSSEREALAAAQSFAAELVPLLSPFVPE